MGTIIEARLEKGRGPVATVLVQEGTLKKGDAVVTGTDFGRVRMMINARGEQNRQGQRPADVENRTDGERGGYEYRNDARCRPEGRRAVAQVVIDVVPRYQRQVRCPGEHQERREDENQRHELDRPEPQHANDARQGRDHRPADGDPMAGAFERDHR